MVCLTDSYAIYFLDIVSYLFLLYNPEPCVLRWFSCLFSFIQKPPAMCGRRGVILRKISESMEDLTWFLMLPGLVIPIWRCEPVRLLVLYFLITSKDPELNWVIWNCKLLLEQPYIYIYIYIILLIFGAIIVRKSKALAYWQYMCVCVCACVNWQ